MVNWFAVHGTAMNNTNKLVSGDNKGHASALFEAAYNPKGTLPGQGDFVGAFAATNLGARALSPTAHAALRCACRRCVLCVACCTSSVAALLHIACAPLASATVCATAALT